MLDRADKMYEDNKYYAATSLYFNSMFTMRFALWKDGYDKASDKEQFLTELEKRVDNQINVSEDQLQNFTLYGVSDVEAVGAAESRITTARIRLDEAEKQNDTQDKISSLAFANERARTAQWWLTLSTPDGKIVPEKNTERPRRLVPEPGPIYQYLYGNAYYRKRFPSGYHRRRQRGHRSCPEGNGTRLLFGAIFDSLQATIKSALR